METKIGRLISVLREAYTKEQIVRSYHVIYAEEVAAENAALADENVRLRDDVKQLSIQKRSALQAYDALAARAEASAAVSCDDIISIIRSNLSGPTGRDPGIQAAHEQDVARTADLILSALTTNPDAAVKIKPLEWEDLSDHEPGWWVAKNDNLSLGYEVRVNSRDIVRVRFPGKTWETFEGIPEHAKAAAQADYERRILSALTTEPAAPQGAEPVAEPPVGIVTNIGGIKWFGPNIPLPCGAKLYSRPPAQAVTEAQVEAALVKFFGDLWGINRGPVGKVDRKSAMRAALNAAQEAG